MNEIDEILEKAIKKAINNGWQQPHGRELDRVIVNIHWKPDSEKHEPALLQSYESLIFDPDFAKALWGEDITGSFDNNGETIRVPKWQHHLKKMVIADDPIKYLGENI